MTNYDLWSQLTVIDYMLVVAVVWLSGMFVWLIKKFVSSFEQNTKVMTKVEHSLDAMDRKLDTSAERDIEMVKILEKISTKQEMAPNVEVVIPHTAIKEVRNS